MPDVPEHGFFEVEPEPHVIRYTSKINPSTTVEWREVERSQEQRMRFAHLVLGILRRLADPDPPDEG